MAAGGSSPALTLKAADLTLDDGDVTGVDCVMPGVTVPRLVVAIDFGTFASGYALQWRSDFTSDRLKIHYNTKWQSGGFCTYKTPTCLLLRPDRTLQAFGYAAEQEFSRLEMDDHGGSPQDWYFFKQFKMVLYNRDGLTDNTPIEDYHGKTLPVIEVFSKSIIYMKEHVINHLKENGLPYPETETKWVLTVPAIWDDPAKQVMRRSAERAGIHGDNLSIALEPEAAAIYCSQMHVSDAQMEIEGDAGRLIHVAAPGSTVMVVDMGGGTVDITTVNIDSDGTMKQIFESGGGAWGGMKVDAQFTGKLKTVIGEDTLAEFTRTCLLDDYDMRMEFESRKRELREKRRHADDSFFIKLPSTLKDMWEDRTGMKVMDILQEQPALKGVTFKRGRLVFDADIIREFFQEAISEIIQYVARVLGDEKHAGVTIDSVILVGGFAESSIVVDAVRKSLKDRGIPVVRPQCTELAVLNGAVLFGQNEAILTSRVLRYSYGIGMIMEYNKEIHSDDVRFEADGKQWARDVFRKHVTRGDEVKLGQWISLKEYYPIDEEQTTSTVYIYASDQKDPRYITDAGCKFIGKLHVQFSDSAADSRAAGGSVRRRQRKAVEIAMNFGGTELKIQATDKMIGQKYHTSIKLM